MLLSGGNLIETDIGSKEGVEETGRQGARGAGGGGEKRWEGGRERGIKGEKKAKREGKE